MSHTFLALYITCLILFSVFGLYKLYLLFLFLKSRNKKPVPQGTFADLPRVAIQLPIYNEKYVVKRLLETVVEMDYPKDRLHIQVLDDSTDETSELAARLVEKYRADGYHMEWIHRTNRQGFKAGALQAGMLRTDAEFIAIFDADFMPPANFLRETIHFFTDPGIGMVQAAWSFINPKSNWITRAQSIFLHAHFTIEHAARSAFRRFFNFNGTAGIWRKATLLAACGWEADTLTEDLDVSFRAQIKGWRFVFLRQLRVMSELPVDILGFKRQQFRWTKGLTQCAKKLLPEIWKSSTSLFNKVDATFHLLNFFGYLTSFAMSIVVLPALFLYHNIFHEWAILFTFLFLGINFAGIFIYHVVSEYYAAEDGTVNPLAIFYMMLLGIGLSFNGVLAVLSAFFNIKSEFKRTPKYSVTNNQQKISTNYAYRLKLSYSLLGEATLCLYFIFLCWRLFPYLNIYLISTFFIFAPGYFFLVKYQLAQGAQGLLYRFQVMLRLYRLKLLDSKAA